MIRLPKKRFAFVAATLLGISTHPTIAQNEIANPDYREEIQETRSILESMAAGGEYAGLSVTVAVGDTIVYAEGFGYANINTKEEATPDHLFRIYSVAKVITGTAVARLIEAGEIDPDLPIETYVPFDGPARNVTVRELAGHLAGVRHYSPGEWIKLSRVGCRSAFDAIAHFAKDPLEHEPGDRFTYSSFGFVLLSLVVEAVTGQPFAEYLSSAILGPSGTRDIRAEGSSENEQMVVEPYEYRRRFFFLPRRLTPARDVNNTCKLGAGGYIASTNALAHFGLALTNGRLVTSETLELVMTSMTDASGAMTNYGFGIGVGQDREGRLYGIHSGSAIGGRGVLLVYPTARVVVAIATNSDGDTLADEARAIGLMFVEH